MAIINLSFGANINGELNDETGHLIVSGSGDMNNWISTSYPLKDYIGVLQSIVVEEGITSLGNYFAYQCTALSNVVLPSTIIVVGSYSFGGCVGLSWLVNKATSSQIFGASPFDFTPANPPIDIWGFSSNSNYKNYFTNENLYTWNEGIPPIRIELGKNVVGLLDESTNHLQIVGTGATTRFTEANYPLKPYKDTILTVTIEEGITVLENYCFYACSALCEISLPSTLDTLGTRCFSYCTSLEDIDISNVSKIWNSCFEGSGLISVVVPNGVTSLEWSIFQGCPNLKYIELPSGINVIASGNFDNLPMLETFINHAQISQNILSSIKINSTVKPVQIHGHSTNVKFKSQFTYGEDYTWNELPLPPQKPANFDITLLDKCGFYATWDIEEDVEYNVYIGDRLVDAVISNNYTYHNEVDDYVRLIAVNDFGETGSDSILVQTKPNPLTDIKVDYIDSNGGYDFTVSFDDSSNVESGYKVKYTVDSEQEQVVQAQDEYVLQEGETQDSVDGHKILKTFNSSGEDIVVENGVDKSKICLATIEGQTVKNLITTNTSFVVDAKPSSITRTIDKLKLRLEKTTSDDSTGHCVCRTSIKSVVESTKSFCLLLNIKTNKTEIQLGSSKLMINCSPQVGFGATTLTNGLMKFTCTTSTLADNSGYIYIYPSTTDWVVGDYLEIEIYGFVDNIYKDVISKLETGLNSAQAIISNSSAKYPFYASEEDKLAGKPIELHKVGDVSDTLEYKSDGSLEWVETIGNIVLNGSEDWKFIENINPNTFVLTISDMYIATSNNELVVECDVLKAVNAYNMDNNKELMSISARNIGNQGIWVSLNRTETLNEFKTWLKSNNIYVKYRILTPTSHTIPKEINPPVPIHETNILSFGDAVKPSNVSLVAPVMKPPITATFNVPSVSTKVKVTASVYNAIGENELGSTIDFYTPPTFRWDYIVATKEVLLSWVDNCPADSQYKIKYRIGNGTYQYITISGDGSTTGTALSQRISLADTATMEVSLCSVTTQDGFYTAPITVSKALDVNLNPPTHFTYEWIEREKIRLKWTDNHDCEESFDLFYNLDNSTDTQIAIPSTTKESKGAVYTYDVAVPLSSTIRARVRANYVYNISSLASLTVTNKIDAPQNVQISTVGVVSTITWDEVRGATGYKIFLDSKLIADVQHNTAIIEHDLYGFITVVAYNEKLQSESSAQVYVKTVPNKPLWVDVDHEKTDIGYDFQVQFTDNSVIETHYRVEYQVDDGQKQSFDIDTENMPLPPNTHLDEDKTYLMWSDIQKTDGSDIELEGVQGEIVDILKISGNTDDTGYYPMSVGTVDPLSVGVNDEVNPIRFETKIKSTDGSAKKVVDVARFQEIDMIIEGKTIRDEVNNTLNSVKPMIYNENGIAHTITLDNCKGKTEIRYEQLVSREDYGCTLGSVDDVIDQIYRDRVVYRTKQYDITGLESWQIDNTKTNGTYTVISNIVLDNCPVYGADEAFKMVSNKFVSQSYSDTTYAHLKCMYTDKLTLMFQNTQLGITGTDSTSAKITKCKNYLATLGASIRYVVKNVVEEEKVIDFFVGDSFELGEVGNFKDICNTKKECVTFQTMTSTFESGDDEDWKWYSLGDAENCMCFYIANTGVLGGHNVVLSDKFPYIPLGYTSSNDTESICTSTNPYIFVKINRSRLASQNMAGFKEWLKRNPIKVNYILKNPYTEKINILQDTFVVDSQDGGDREVEIANNHFEDDGIITKGLVYDKVATTELPIMVKEDNFSIMLKSKMTNGATDTPWYIQTSASSSWLFFVSAKRGYGLYDGQNYYSEIIPKKDDIIYIEKKGEVTKLFINNKVVINVKLNTSKNQNLVIKSLVERDFSQLYVYNRILSPQELLQNQKVMLSKMSILDKVINLSDETPLLHDKKSISGGIESGFLSGSIEGQTVKNYIGSSIPNEKISISKNSTRTYNSSQIAPNTFYKLRMYVSEGDKFPSGFIKFYCLASDGVFFDIWLGSVQSAGWYESIISLPKETKTIRLQFSTPTDSDVLVVSDISLTFLDENSILGAGAVQGLNSTQAIININDQEYPVCNPIIEGKTKVMKNGVEAEPQEGAVLESLSSSDNSLPELGSVGAVSDVVDLNTYTLTINTKEAILDGGENWAIASTDGAITRFYLLNFGLAYGSSSLLTKVIGDRFSYIGNGSNFKEGLGSYALDGRLYLNVSNDKATSVSELKQWLQANPVTVRYQLAIPIVQQLTQEQTYAYNEHKKIIELNRIGDVKDEFILNEDGSGTHIKRTNSYKLGLNLTNWLIQSIPSDNLVGFYTHKDNIDTNIAGYSSRNILLCNKLKTGMAGVANNTNAESINFNADGANLLLDIEKDKVADSDSLNRYLMHNDYLVILALVKPVTTHISKHLMPKIQV